MEISEAKSWSSVEGDSRGKRGDKGELNTNKTNDIDEAPGNSGGKDSGGKNGKSGGKNGKKGKSGKKDKDKDKRKDGEPSKLERALLSTSTGILPNTCTKRASKTQRELTYLQLQNSFCVGLYFKCRRE